MFPPHFDGGPETVAELVDHYPLKELARHNPSLQRRRLRYSPGLAPTTRLNALLKAAPDS
jgi:hypothetical protein